MSRLALSILLLAVLPIYPGHDQHVSVPDALEGVYEFVSDTIVATKPKKLTQKVTSPQWVGLWLFKDGYFSQTLMKRERQFWLPRFPRNAQELGYKSAAGAYKIQGKILELIPSLRLSPYYIDQSWLLEYRLEGETLTLLETLHANPHDETEGEHTIVLRRIS